jgi:hypothetical protein
MVGIRTLYSLAQFLDLLNGESLVLLLEKHGLDVNEVSEVLQYRQRMGLPNALVRSVRTGGESEIFSLLEEIVRTSDDLRYSVSPRYRFDQRFEDLERCLQLDNYIIANRRLVPIDRTIVGAPQMDDDLTKELNESGLPMADDVTKKLADSVNAFRATTPNYNASLNDARIALQTLATDIANTRLPAQAGSFDSTKWGSVINYLRSSGFITTEEERGLAGVFGFVSPGSHRPVGLSDAEFARLGRSFVVGMCWFLVKRYRADSSSHSADGMFPSMLRAPF